MHFSAATTEIRFISAIAALSPCPNPRLPKASPRGVAARRLLPLLFLCQMRIDRVVNYIVCSGEPSHIRYLTRLRIIRVHDSATPDTRD